MSPSEVGVAFPGADLPTGPGKTTVATVPVPWLGASTQTAFATFVEGKLQHVRVSFPVHQATEVERLLRKQHPGLTCQRNMCRQGTLSLVTQSSWIGFLVMEGEYLDPSMPP